jgi:signal transduction histidine kinase
MSTTAAALLDLVLHEMRTPITVATGSLRQVGPLGEATAQAAIDRAIRSCARLDQLASQMRDWVRTIETPPATEVQAVDDLVRTAVTRAKANRTPDPAVQIDQGPPVKAAGAPALADALASLIEAVGRAAEPGENITVSWAPHGDGTRISIRRGDRPDADPSGTFDAELMGGLGFALPLARAIVEAGGGRLTSRRDAQGRVDAVTLLLAPATPPR